MEPNLPIVEVESGIAGVQQALRAVHELFESDKSCALIPAGDSKARAAVQADTPLIGEEPSLVLVTSGSMGEPKAAELSVTALSAAAEAAAIEFARPACWLTAIPVTGIGGLNTLVRSALTGTAPVIWEGVSGAASFVAADFTKYLRAVRTAADKQNMAAAVSLVPTQIERIRLEPAAVNALSDLDFVLVGGAALSAASKTFLNQQKVNLIATYGATESCGGVVWNHKPLGDTKILLDADNQILIESSMLATAYRDGSMIAPRWATGDLGTWNEHRLEITGRIDRVIKSNGKKISLDALTNAASGLAGVEMAFAIAVSDSAAGAIPVIAYSGEITPAELKTMVAASPDFPTLTQFRIFDKLPMLSNGKPDAATIATICQTPRP